MRSGLLSMDEVEERRQSSVLLEVLPVLREALVTVADAAQHIMVVSDADGRVLWREGSAAVLRKADRLGFELGADWSEETVGTNGVGTPLVTRRPVQVFSAEHFVRVAAHLDVHGGTDHGPARRAADRRRRRERPPGDDATRRRSRSSGRSRSWRRRGCGSGMRRRSTGCGPSRRRSSRGSAAGRSPWTSRAGRRR